jgi:hypothetical protein
LAPRNIAVVNSFIGDKIYIIDTENITEVTDDTEKERLAEMKFLFKIFSENLNPKLSPRYQKRYEQDELTSPSLLISSKSLIRQWEKMALLNQQIIKKDEKKRILSPKVFKELKNDLTKTNSEKKLFKLPTKTLPSRKVSDVEIRKFHSLKEIGMEDTLTPRIPSPTSSVSSPSETTSTRSVSPIPLKLESPMKKANSYSDVSDSIFL